jgi:hypothetical protein
LTIRKLVAALVLPVVVLAAACGGGDAKPAPTSAPPTALAVATPAPTQPPATPTRAPQPPRLTPVAGPSPTPRPELVGVPELQGLDPASKSLVTGSLRQLGPKPEPVAPTPLNLTGALPTNDANVRHTTLWDIQSKKAYDLGAGGRGSFSPNSKQMVWVAGNDPVLAPSSEIWLLDLTTLKAKSLGMGRGAGFIDDGHVVTFVNGNNRVSIDVVTNARAAYSDEPPFVSANPQPAGNAIVAMLDRQNNDEGLYLISDAATKQRLFQVRAVNVQPVSPKEVLVATLGVNGLTNVYLVTLPAGTSTYIGTAPYSFTIPLAGTSDYIAWTDQFCGAGSPKAVVLYDRRTTAFTRIDSNEAVTFSSGGLLGFGSFGAKALVDPSTLQYVAVLPDQGDIAWSPDYHFASGGATGGHGGPCP